jgi:hypothetical protein
LRSCVVLVPAFCRADRAGRWCQAASLRQAIAHLVKTITAPERGSPEVLIAAELLTNAAEHGGPVEFARIAILQALMSGQHVLGDIHRAAIAHHGWGVYDTSKSFTVTGTILSQIP